jgi:hypothetical protein
MQQLWKTAWQFLKNFKTEFPYDLATPLQGIHPKKLKIGFQRNIYRSMFIPSLFTIAKT